MLLNPKCLHQRLSELLEACGVPKTARLIILNGFWAVLSLIFIKGIIFLLLLSFQPITRDIYIFASFYYENSTSFLPPGLDQPPGQFDTVAILFLANSDDEFPYIQCTSAPHPLSQKQGIKPKSGQSPAASESDQLVPAQLSQLDYTGNCNLILFVAWCHLPRASGTISDQKEAGGGGRKGKKRPIWLDLGPQILGDQRLRKDYLQYKIDPILHKIQPKAADTRPRKLVMCISRVFAFENWRLLILAIETYKAFGVDLVVIPVYSAIAPVFKLMRAYEKQGLLTLREGVRLPFLRQMQYDPERELEYSGQLAMAHQCFYEFRASAQFIGLVDLDDLLISPSRPSISGAMARAAQNHPNAPYFYINKLESGILREKGAHFDAHKVLRKNIFTKRQYNSEKMVVRPERMYGFWVHFSRDYLGEHKPVQLPTQELLILHLSKELNETNLKEYDENLLADAPMNWTIFEKEKSSGVNDEIWKLLPSMPPAMLYSDSIRHCSKYLNAYPSLLQPPPCLSYSLCQLQGLRPRKGTARECVVVRSEYSRRSIGPANIYTVHINQWNGFHLSTEGCFVGEREEA